MTILLYLALQRWRLVSVVKLVYCKIGGSTTVLIHHKICPVGVSWPDCSSDLFELIADEHDIIQVSCSTVNPHGCCKFPANIAKIRFKGQDHPDIVYIGRVFCNVKWSSPKAVPKQLEIQTSIIYCRSTARCPLCASSGHTCTNCPSMKQIYLCKLHSRK